MDREDIIRMANDVGIKGPAPARQGFKMYANPSRLKRFAALVAAAERTRLHDKFMEVHKSQQHSNNYWHFAARKIKEEA